MSEPLESQVDRLAKFILAEIDGEPSQNEGATDTAIRLLRERHGPVAIVDAALREKAATKACDAFNEIAEEPVVSGEALWNAVADAVLSTVLGRPVRYAKEMVTVDAQGDTHAAIGYLDRDELLLSMRDGDDIAILEEAGKEE